MNPRDILFSSEARQKLVKGAEIVARAVGSTLGPKGRNVALASKFAGIIIVHDGVTVAREIRLKDRMENVGAMLIRSAAQKTNDDTGDGTTTATVLAFEIIKEGMKAVETGVDPMALRRGIEIAVFQTIEYLKKQAKKITEKDIIKVATISSSNEEIGAKVAEAMQKVGKYGVVTTTDGPKLGYEVEYKEGMEWDKGWNLPTFITDLRRMESIIKDPLILITDYSISSVEEMLPIITACVQAGKKNLLIISDGIDRNAQALLIENLNRGIINALCVSAPSLGEHKRDGLEDIAILTGGVFISQEAGRTLKEVRVEELGRATQAVATRESTTIVGGAGDKEKIKERVEQIKKQIEDSKHEYEKERYTERLAKLTSGVAVIKVGGSSDAEIREKIERVKDAIGATKAAREEGIVAGGGIALLKATDSLSLEGLYKEVTGATEEEIGFEIVRKALKAPLKLLAENAGQNGEVVVAELMRRPQEEGFNVQTGEYVNMIEAGIIDPVKVTISALQNASSIASMILTTEALIVEDDSEEKKNAT